MRTLYFLAGMCAGFLLTAVWQNNAGAIIATALCFCAAFAFAYMLDEKQ